MPSEVWGRERELAAVRLRLADALHGRPSVVVLAGEPGIGKTSMLRALVEEAGSDATVLWTRGIVTGDAPPYSMWGALAPLPAAAGADRFTVFESIRSAVLERAPLVLVVDDLQWADAASLAALTYVVRRLGTEPVLVAASLRTDDAAEAWQSAGAELLAEHLVTRIDVEGLAPEDSAEVLRSACRVPLSDEDVARGVGLSRGNPFYLTELGKSWSIDPAGNGLPGSVLDVVTHRLARLPNATQELLRAASVLGDEVEISVVAHCLGLSAMECLPAVQSALDARLLERATAPGVVRFSHELVRTALVERLSVLELVSLHQRAAAAIEELHAEALDRHLGALARHHAAAAVSGGAERDAAVAWAIRAAEAATADAAYEEAAGWFGLALECGGDGLDVPTWVRATLGRAAADFAAGRLDAARAGCRAVAARLPKDDAPSWTRLGLALEAIGERAWDRDVRQWCEHALRLADPGELAVRSRLTARCAEALVYEGRWEDAVVLTEEALELAAEVEDPAVVAAALRARQLACLAPELHDERVGLAVRMTQLGVDDGRPDIELWGRLWSIDAAWEDGDLATVAVELSRLGWVVEQLGSPTARWHALVTQAALAQARGEQAEALATGREAFELMAAMGHAAGFGAFMSLLGALGHHFGHEPMSLRPPPDLAPAEGEMRAELFGHLGPAFALAESGRLGEAATLYARPGPPATWRIPPFFRIPALYCGAHLAVRLGRLDDVAFLRQQLEPYRGGHVVGGGGPASYLGPVELVLGVCAAALGDLDAAEQDLRYAVLLAEERGLPGFVVEARCELASVLFGQRRRAEGRRLLEQAAPEAERLGMVPWVERISAGLEVTTDPLSSREREVALLVAEGLSNREIADRLVLSERTAANHVQHVLTKLGFARRAEIAAWVARQ